MTRKLAHGKYGGRAYKAAKRQLPAKLEHDHERAYGFEQVPQEAIQVIRDETRDDARVGREAREQVACFVFVKETNFLLDESAKHLTSYFYVYVRDAY